MLNFILQSIPARTINNQLYSNILLFLSIFIWGFIASRKVTFWRIFSIYLISLLLVCIFSFTFIDPKLSAYVVYFYLYWWFWFFFWFVCYTFFFLKKDKDIVGAEHYSQTDQKESNNKLVIICWVWIILFLILINYASLYIWFWSPWSSPDAWVHYFVLEEFVKLSGNFFMQHPIYANSVLHYPSLPYYAIYGIELFFKLDTIEAYNVARLIFWLASYSIFWVLWSRITESKYWWLIALLAVIPVIWIYYDADPKAYAYIFQTLIILLWYNQVKKWFDRKKTGLLILLFIGLASVHFMLWLHMVVFWVFLWVLHILYKSNFLKFDNISKINFWLRNNHVKLFFVISLIVFFFAIWWRYVIEDVRFFFAEFPIRVNYIWSFFVWVSWLLWLVLIIKENHKKWLFFLAIFLLVTNIWFFYLRMRWFFHRYFLEFSYMFAIVPLAVLYISKYIWRKWLNIIFVWLLFSLFWLVIDRFSFIQDTVNRQESKMIQYRENFHSIGDLLFDKTIVLHPCGTINRFMIYLYQVNPIWLNALAQNKCERRPIWSWTFQLRSSDRIWFTDAVTRSEITRSFFENPNKNILDEIVLSYGPEYMILEKDAWNNWWKEGNSEVLEFMYDAWYRTLIDNDSFVVFVL